jgi:hypothetical protein
MLVVGDATLIARAWACMLGRSIAGGYSFCPVRYLSVNHE